MAITLITTAGQQAIAEAIANKSTLKIASIAVGDGGGATYTPTVSQTALKGQKWSGELNRKEINPENEKQIIFEGRIASGVGGFYIREVGLFDENNVLVAVSDFPESFKAAADQYELYIRMIVEFANTDITNIIVKQDMIYATKEYVDNAVKSSTAIDDLKKDFNEHQADLAHVHWVGTATGTNALIATYAPITEYKEGLGVSFKNTTASTAATSLNINGLGAIPIINSEGEAQSELKANGVYTVRYSGGNFLLQGSQGVSKATQISNLTATVGFSTAGQVQLNWINPNDPKLKGVRIMYKTGSYPSSPTDGTLFYDSNDTTPANTLTKQGFTDGTQYYFRAFAWTYKNATRVYTTDTAGAQCTAIPYQSIGMVNLTYSTTWVAPVGVKKVDLFLVGGGGAGGGANNSYITAGGGAGGVTKTYKSIDVTPGTAYPVVVGAGAPTCTYGTGDTGGTSSIVINGVTYSASGGSGGNASAGGGAGGSGGGGGYYGSGTNTNPQIGGTGGSDGSNGLGGTYPGTGQGTTTRAFGETTGTLYSGGGGGGSYFNASAGGNAGAGGGGKGGLQGAGDAGIANTGGGGGGGANAPSGVRYGGAGGSGIVIIRWGY